ncbi:MAG: hypothetical protein ACLFRI_02590 [Candidatus Izemoplasmataceae bacterium]
MTSLTFKRPGKLYLAGEYAVVKGNYAILFPTKKTMDLTIQSSDYFSFAGVPFKLNAKLEVSLGLPYVQQAINIAHTYLDQEGKTIKPYAIETTNHLEIPKKPKLGIGTSAMITILLIEAILGFHDVSLDTLTLYKLGVLAQINHYPDSSFGDLALVASSDSIIYQPFEERFRKRLISEGLKVLKLPWPNLTIKTIDLLSVPMLIIHTNEAASSLSLVKKVMKYEDTLAFIEFANQSNFYVNALINAQNNLEFMAVIKKLNHNLKALETLTKTKLFTKNMVDIEKIIHDYHGVCKFSGAGGGDSMLAFFPDEKTKLSAQLAIEKSYPILNHLIMEDDYEQKR